MLMTQLDKSADLTPLELDSLGRAQKVIDSVDRLKVPSFVKPKDLTIVILFLK